MPDCTAQLLSISETATYFKQASTEEVRGIIIEKGIIFTSSILLLFLQSNTGKYMGQRKLIKYIIQITPIFLVLFPPCLPENASDLSIISKRNYSPTKYHIACVSHTVLFYHEKYRTFYLDYLIR